jgi:hypothetical protein
VSCRLVQLVEKSAAGVSCRLVQLVEKSAAGVSRRLVQLVEKSVVGVSCRLVQLVEKSAAGVSCRLVQLVEKSAAGVSCRLVLMLEKSATGVRCRLGSGGGKKLHLGKLPPLYLPSHLLWKGKVLETILIPYYGYSASFMADFYTVKFLYFSHKLLKRTWQ